MAVGLLSRVRSRSAWAGSLSSGIHSWMAWAKDLHLCLRRRVAEPTWNYRRLVSVVTWESRYPFGAAASGNCAAGRGSPGIVPRAAEWQ